MEKSEEDVQKVRTADTQPDEDSCMDEVTQSFARMELDQVEAE